MALPEVRLLQAAIAVARDLNFSRAAERLHIGQSTLSKQIYELESQLGFRLFNRNHQTVEVTDAGRAFVEEAREAILHIERGWPLQRQFSMARMKSLSRRIQIRFSCRLCCRYAYPYFPA